MKRFSCTIFDKSGVDGKAMKSCKIGDYVKHSTAIKRITEMEKQIQHLADIHTKSQLRIRQLEAMASSKIIALKEQVK